MYAIEPHTENAISAAVKSSILAKMKYHQYRIIAAHMFKWINLPPGLESEDMERMLMDHGTVSMFNTLEGLYILPYTLDQSTINVYGKPSSVRPFPFNTAQLTQLDTIPRILWDNSEKEPFDIYLKAFAMRLATIQRSIEINERKARTPSVTAVTEDNKESYARFQSQIDEGKDVIFVDTHMALDAISVLPTGFQPAIMDSLWNNYNKVEGEIYALLGTMFNVEQNKLSGVGNAETIVNYSQTFAIANSRLEQRQRWCEKVNAEFKLGIMCEKANDYQDIIAEMMQANSMDVDNIAGNASKVQAGEQADAEVKSGATTVSRPRAVRAS